MATKQEIPDNDLEKNLAEYKAKDIVETMLVDQMFKCNEIIKSAIRRSKDVFLNDPIEQLNIASKFMRIFNDQVSCLKRYKKYGGPNLSFNTVNANQAVVGSVSVDKK